MYIMKQDFKVVSLILIEIVAYALVWAYFTTICDYVILALSPLSDDEPYSSDFVQYGQNATHFVLFNLSTHFEHFDMTTRIERILSLVFVLKLGFVAAISARWYFLVLNLKKLTRKQEVFFCL